MEVPKRIKRNRYTYRLIKKVNDRMYLYEEEKVGWKECFLITDLIQIQSARLYGRTGTPNFNIVNQKRKGKK